MFFGIVGVFIACAVAPSVSIPIGHWYVSTKNGNMDLEKNVSERVLYDGR